MALRNLGLFCSDMNVFQTLVFNIVLQLSTIGSDYAKCALLSRMQKTCVLTTKDKYPTTILNKIKQLSSDWQKDFENCH